jgi:hypothetical protein
MPLIRYFFLLFAAGFSLALLLKQSIVLLIDRRKQGLNLILYFSFLIYLLIQLVNAWSLLEKRTIPNFVYVTASSTVLYSLTLCATLYISMKRVCCFYQTGLIHKMISKITIVVPLVLFVVRIVRTVLVFIQSTSSTIFPAIAILQLITLFPVLILRAIFDITSLFGLVYITNRSNSFYQIDDKATTKGAVHTMMISLSYELGLSLFSLFVAIVEAFNYEYDMVAFIDWLLISWCIASSIDQRDLYRTIFSNATTHWSGTIKSITHINGRDA